jgi:1-acyl-sn-glycerol-3-phosphate acyltransferase
MSTGTADTARPERDERAAPAPPLTHSTLVYRLGRTVCRLELALLHRMVVRDRQHIPSRGGCLVVANHQSFLDIPIVAAAVPRHVAFVARDTLARSRFLAFLMRQSGSVLVKRASADRAALERIIDHLRAGDCVAVFPEGTRSREGSLGEFRAGAMFAARRAGVPMIPAAIVGAVDAMPRSARVPRPRRIEIRFAPPVLPEGEDAFERVRAAIVARLGDGHLGRPPAHRSA